MFYVIYIAVIVFALYLIFHDRPEGEGERRREQKRPTSTYRPEGVISKHSLYFFS